MARTVAETIRETCREHLLKHGGLILGQCLSAVGWVGGTVPELTEEQGILELSMADVAGGGIAVGAALMGRRPIYVIRYQGFMWYNSPALVNYAAKAKEMWGTPCPMLIRSIAMEGNGIGPVTSSCQHGIVMRMPGLPVCAPMTPGEWLQAWTFFMQHDDPVYVSEHRQSYGINYEMTEVVRPESRLTIVAISYGRITAMQAVKQLEQRGVACDLFHLLWLKPFEPDAALLDSLRKTGLGLVIDSDFEIAGPSRSIAYELMHKTGARVYALGLEDRTCGVAPHLENVTPSAAKVVDRVVSLVGG